MTQRFQTARILPITLTCISFCLADVLEVMYEFKYVDYNWDSKEQKANAIASGKYDKTQIFPCDIQPLKDGRILVTTPKHSQNPASLSTISSKADAGGPLLAPYPNWSWHTKNDCSGITSVNRVILDKFDRLWLVDSGKIGAEKPCEAKILVFDATTDQLLESWEIPSELAHNPNNKEQGLLEIAAVETSDSVDGDFWVYISDIIGYAIVIWNGKDMWRLESPVFSPDPNSLTYSINGENVTLAIGPSSVLITPSGYLKNPALLFKAQSSIVGHAVSLEDLHNSNSGISPTYYSTNFIASSQELARAYSRNGYLIAGFSTEMMLACWNLQYPLEEQYIGFLVTGDLNLQYVSGVKIIADRTTSDESIYVLSNKLQKFVLGTMDFSEDNFKILTADPNALVEGTPCAPLPKTEYTVADGIQDKAFSLYEA